MKLEIRKNEEAIELVENSNVIEKYELNQPITFIKLFELLLSDEFQSDIELYVDSQESIFTDKEKELIGFIEKIVEDYNNKKTELDNMIVSENVK